MSPRKKKTIIEIPSNLSCVTKVSENILNALKDYRLSDAYLFDIRLSIEEALRNAIEHGNKLNSSLSVKVSFCVTDGKLEISVEDTGAGFDFKNLADPTTEENIMRPAIGQN